MEIKTNFGLRNSKSVYFRNQNTRYLEDFLRYLENCLGYLDIFDIYVIFVERPALQVRLCSVLPRRLTGKTLGRGGPNPGDERPYGEYSKMAAVLCGLVADSLPAKTVSERFIA